MVIEISNMFDISTTVTDSYILYLLVLCYLRSREILRVIWITGYHIKPIYLLLPCFSGLNKYYWFNLFEKKIHTMFRLIRIRTIGPGVAP